MKASGREKKFFGAYQQQYYLHIFLDYSIQYALCAHIAPWNEVTSSFHSVIQRMCLRMHDAMCCERFEDYRLEGYANTIVEVTNTLFFPCTSCYAILCLSYFSQKLWIVHIQ